MTESDSLHIYNSLGREKQVFEPQNPPTVKMYVCGVTVYDDCHVGHGRAYVTFDLVRRFLEYEGYEVDFVENFTDVEDKIINRARERDRTPRDLAAEYTRAYFEVMDRLNIRRADVYPTVTGHIPEIIDHVQGLIENGMAYEVEGDVYFDVEKFPEYGKLSGQDPDEMEAGSRVEVDESKRSPLDFALWKSSGEDEPSWESPWGPGRPGWHIECSVMSRTHLGDTLDIHGGGRDLIFPHHENEIAQTEGLTGKPFARFWMHNGFVTIDDEKMSKSEGNFYTLKEVFDRFEPAVVRFFFLTRHYRSPLNFSFDRLEEARDALDRLRDFFERLREAESWPGGGEAMEPPSPDLDKHRHKFLRAMRDDFNSAEALGHLQNWVGDWNRTLDEWDRQPALHRSQHEAINTARDWMETVGEEVLGLGLTAEETPASDAKLDDLFQVLIDLREEARETGDYETADAIRDQLRDRGFELKDTPKGTRWETIDE